MNESRYADIINRAHPISRRHPPMSRLDRAAQFAPFAALTGYEEAVMEAGRLTDSKPEIDDGCKAEINQLLLRLRQQPGTKVKIKYFKPDDKKAGGACLSAMGSVKKIDDYALKLIFADGSAINIDDILEMEISTGGHGAEDR